MTIAPGGAGRTKRYVIQKAASTSRTNGPSVSARSRHETLRNVKRDLREGDGIGAFMLHRLSTQPTGGGERKERYLWSRSNDPSQSASTPRRRCVSMRPRYSTVRPSPGRSAA